MGSLHTDVWEQVHGILDHSLCQSIETVEEQCTPDSKSDVHLLDFVITDTSSLAGCFSDCHYTEAI